MSLTPFPRYNSARDYIRPVQGLLKTAVVRNGEEIEIVVDYECVPGAPAYDDCPAYNTIISVDVVEPRGFRLTEAELLHVEQRVLDVVFVT